MGKISQFQTTQHRGRSRQPLPSIAKSYDSTDHPRCPAPRAGEVGEERDNGSEDEREDGEHVVDAMGSTSGNLNGAGTGPRQESAG
jgi:hypothetical protein